MPIAVVCPNCNAKLNAPDAAAGKTVKCPKCKEPMVIPEVEAEADAGFETVDEPQPPKKTKSVVKKDVVLDDDDEDEEEEERPRKKKGKKKPAKAGLSPVLIASIVGGVLLLGGGAFAVYWFGFRASEPKSAATSTTGPPVMPMQMGPPVPGGPNVPGPNTGGDTPTPTPAPSGPIKPLYESNDVATAAYRSASTTNLRQIGIAMHTHSDVYGAFPAGIYDSTGNVGLSWRVAVLPFIEQENLYREFKLNEPWNSEHNKKLIPLMPKTYAAPGQDPKKGLTFYRSFTGAGTAFPTPPRGAAGKPAFGLKMSGVTDGLSNTALVVEAGDPVEWTKPDELVFSPSGAAPRLGGIFEGSFFVLLGDGSSRRMKSNAPEATIKAMITAKGGEVVNFDE